MKKKSGLICVLVCVLSLLLLTACGQKAETIDYGDAESFEAALNNGEDLTGKIVQFEALELHPQSVYGYNIWAGEHLNFVSSTNPDVSAGDTVVVKATTIESSMGSWFIYYDKVDDAVVGDATIFSTDAQDNEGTDETGSTAGSTSVDTESTAAAVSVEPAAEQQELTIEDSGWYLSAGGDSSYLHFCAMIHNPNTDLIAEFPKVDVTVRDSDGSILATEEQVGSIIMPGDTITLCGMMSLPVAELSDDAEVSFEAGCSDFSASSSFYQSVYTTDFEITNISERTGDDTYITGEIVNNYAEDVEEVNLSLVLRQDGKIVYMDNTFVDDLAAGESTPFEFQYTNTLPEHDTAELSAMVW